MYINAGQLWERDPHYFLMCRIWWSDGCASAQWNKINQPNTDSHRDLHVGLVWLKQDEVTAYLLLLSPWGKVRNPSNSSACILPASFHATATLSRSPSLSVLSHSEEEEGLLSWFPQVPVSVCGGTRRELCHCGAFLPPLAPEHLQILSSACLQRKQEVPLVWQETSTVPHLNPTVGLWHRSPCWCPEIQVSG